MKFCPICSNTDTALLIDIEFDGINILPKNYKTHYCPSCDFGFSRPELMTEESLDEYYSSVNNDNSADFVDKSRFQKQFKFLESNYNFKDNSNILDFGCGNADLLKILSNQSEIRFNKLIGFDINFGMQEHFLENSLSKIFVTGNFDHVARNKFDLIILSHTLEHLINFEILDTLRESLTDDGEIYIEVPNAAQYLQFERSQIFYYFDRLHINHFSLVALAKLSTKFDLRVAQCFEYSFTYSDSAEYPAIGVFLKKNEVGLTSFVNSELKRIEVLRESLAGRELIIWGLGDNFSRLDHLNLFDKSKIVSLVDLRRRGMKYKGYSVSDLDSALEMYPDALLVITISWNRSELMDLVFSKNPNRTLIFV
jgi:SAM-dependent methyltransferase